MTIDERQKERWEAAVARYFEALQPRLNPIYAQAMTIMLPSAITNPPKKNP